MGNCSNYCTCTALGTASYWIRRFAYRGNCGVFLACNFALGRIGLFVGSFEAFITVFTLLFAGEGLKALAYFGISLAMAGLGILLLLVGVKLTKYPIELAKKLINKIKTKMVLKGAKK